MKETILSAVSSDAQMTLGLADDDFVDFVTRAADGGLNILENGFLQVTSASIGTNALPLASNGGSFFQYQAAAEQRLTPTGIEVDYTSLHYDLIGYTGYATFGHDPQTGAPTVSGAQNQRVLSSGDLISGKLLQANDGFAGTVTATQNAGGSASTIGTATFAINNGPPTNGPKGGLLFDGGSSTAILSHPVSLS